MRVISGQARGMKLVSPPGLQTRPTLDRVKESVFNMLMPYICDATVLDLFAGSGAMGIEALSRGAQRCVFLDNSKESVECIKANLTSARLLQNADVVYVDSMDYLKKCRGKFDLIFVDPPYEAGLYASTLQLIDSNNLLSEEGFVIVEWDYEFGFTDNLFGFEVFRDKKYGRVGITILKRGTQK